MSVVKKYCKRKFQLSNCGKKILMFNSHKSDQTITLNMNKVTNKFLVSGEKFMPELYLREL